MSYKHSIWYVPYNYKQLKNEFNMTHIPHITLKTMMERDECFDLFDKLVKKEFYFTLQNDLVLFPSMYEQDPMQAIGWWVENSPKYHLSLRYFGLENPKKIKFTQISPPNESLQCFLAIADTSDCNPEKWKLLKS